MNVDDGAWALTELARRRPWYGLARDYYAGRHRLAFATSKFRETFGFLFEAFADNLCTVVVDAVADRLEVSGWTGGDDRDAEGAGAIWRTMRLPQVAGEVHQEALALGDGYLIVWEGRNGRPVWHPNVAEETVVRYDPENPGEVELGAKVWQEGGRDGRARMTLYYRDRVERYATPGRMTNGIPSDPTSFVPLSDDTAQAVVVNPYGIVPVFHFGNAAGVGRLGRPEHYHAIPLQDALNKSVLDGLVGAEFQALPQRWATGLELPNDPQTGEPVSPRQGPGNLLTSPAPDTSFGQFDAADLGQLLTMSESYRLEIARVTGTPAHRMLLTGDRWPSGEALHVAEAPLVVKCTDKTDAWGPTWAQAMQLALRIDLTPAGGELRPLWRDPSSRSVAEQVAVAEAKRRVGVSQSQALRELGYTDEEIQNMQDENAEAAARAVDRGAIV